MDSSSLPPEVRDALRARRAMFAQSPSVLPHLHRRIRVAAMERTSFRERLSAWAAALGAVRPAAYAGACAVLAVALVLARFALPAHSGGTTVAARTTADTSYSLNEVGALPPSLDQKIDAILSGASGSAPRAATASVDAHYVLTSTPASYDSVVAF
jgi:hypothetical protein